MQLFFIYPARAYLTDLPRLTPRYATISGLEFLIFDNANVYCAASKGGGVAYSRSEGSNSYFVKISETVYARALSADDDEHLAKLMSYDMERHAGLLQHAREVLADIPAYAAAQAERIAAARAKAEKEAQERKAKRLEQEREAARQGAEAQAEAERIFKTGGRITWPAFETACKAHGVELHPSTIGAGRRQIRFIGAGSADTIARNVPSGIWRAVRQLKAAMGEG